MRLKLCKKELITKRCLKDDIENNLYPKFNQMANTLISNLVKTPP